MTKYPRTSRIPSQKLESNGMRFYEGIALTADDGVVIAGDIETAQRLARRCFGFDLDPDGAEGVVLLKPERFRELMNLAGIALPEVA